MVSRRLVFWISGAGMNRGAGPPPRSAFRPRALQLKPEHLLLLTLSRRSTIDIHGRKTMTEIDMRKFAVGVVSAAVLLGFTAPATAQSYGWQDHHAQEHEQLDAEHHESHDQLGDEHADAHQWDMSSREHRQLHRELRYEHRANDRQLRQDHRWHDRGDRYRSSDYYGY